MKSAPALQVVWRPPRKTSAALAVLAGLALAVAALTLSAHLVAILERGANLQVEGLWLALAVGLSAAAWVWRQAMACAAVMLRWDGQQWQTAEASSDAGPLWRPTQVVCVTDLGAWLLLRLQGRDATGTPGRKRWLALEQLNHKSEWHALRCALYGPKPLQVHGADAKAGLEPGAAAP